MNPIPFPDFLKQSKCILGEGAVIERLRRDSDCELDNSTGLVEEDPDLFGRSVAGLHGELGLKILGGCCGTDDRHIHCLAARLAAVSS